MAQQASLVVLWGLSCGAQYPHQGLTCVHCIGRQILNLWVTREVPIVGELYWDKSMLSAEVIFKTSTRDCCCLVTKLCMTFCDPMDSIMPGFSVLHHLPESAQIQEINNFKNQMLCDSECTTFRWNDGYCTKWVLCSLFNLFCSFSQSVINSFSLSKLLTVSKPPSP